jgi:hypothetical protein
MQQQQMAPAPVSMQPTMTIVCPSCNNMCGILANTAPGTPLACPTCKNMFQVPMMQQQPQVAGVMGGTGQTFSRPPTQVMKDARCLLIRQKTDFIEMVSSWEKRNKYKIAMLNNPNDPDFDRKWDDKRFKKDLEQVFAAKEESECCQRHCCGGRREFTMDITTKEDKQLAYRLYRPFQCTCVFYC